MIEDNIEKLMRRRRIDKLPKSETRWEFPEPKDSNRLKMKVEEMVDDGDDDEEMPNAIPTQPPSGERPMTCWPPRNPGGSGHAPKPESVKKAEEALLEKWKLPEGPTSRTGDNSTTEETVRSVRSNIPRHPDEAQRKKENDTNSPNSTTTTTQPPSNVQRQLSSKHESASTTNQQQQSTSNHNAQQQQNNQSAGNIKNEEGVKVKSEANKSNVDQQASNENKQSISKHHSDSSGTPQHTTSAPSTPTRSRNSTEGGSQKNTPTKFNVDQLPSFSLSSQYENISFSLSEDLQQRMFRHQPSFTKSGKSDDVISLVGKIGEEIVYSYFCNLYKEALEAHSVEIQWLNEAEETGQPYDMRIKHLAGELEDLFIEVKTTVAEEEREFEISSQQLRFAFETGERFHLYRVSGLATQSDFRLKCLPNLASHMDKKAVKTYMIL